MAIAGLRAFRTKVLVIVPAAVVVPVAIVPIAVIVPAIAVVMMAPVIVVSIAISDRQVDGKMVPLRRLPAIAVAVASDIG